MKKLILFFYAILSLGLIGTHATAEPLTAWDYDLTYGFLGDFTSSVGVGSVRQFTDGTKNGLVWGSEYDSDQQSAIYVDPDATRGTYTIGVSDPVTATNLYHQNNSISARYATLETATLESTFTLSSGGINSGLPSPISFYIGFWETPNESYPEGDYFWLKNPNDLVHTWIYDGYEYTLSFVIDGLMDITVTNDMREALGIDADIGTIKGLLTKEGRTTSFATTFSISSSPVPEPATILLLGFGLLGIAGVGRKKTAA